MPTSRKSSRNKGALNNLTAGCKFLNHYSSIILDAEKVSDTNGLSITKSRIFRVEVVAKMREKQLLPTDSDKLCRNCYRIFKKENFPHTETPTLSAETVEIPLEEIPEEGNDTVKSYLTSLVEGLRSENIDDMIHGKEQLWLELYHLIHEKVLADPVSMDVFKLRQSLTTKQSSQLMTGREIMWQDLLFLIGKVFCRNDMYNDGRYLKDLYKDKHFLINMDLMSYIRGRNQLLIKFFLGLSGIQLNEESNKVKYTFASMVELCYYMRDFTLVLPFSFLGNLIQSCISGSKTVTMFNGKIAPTGGYSTYKRWIEEKGGTPLVCMNGTLDIFIDNIGKYVIKLHGVSSAKRKSADVITTGIQILLEDPLNLQSTSTMPLNGHKVSNKDKNYSNSNSNNENNDVEDDNYNCLDNDTDSVTSIHEKMKNQIKSAHENFRKFRFYFLGHMLGLVKGEKDSNIDKRIAELENKFSKICSKCNNTYTALKRICGDCKLPLERLDDGTGTKVCFEKVDFDELSQSVGQKTKNEVHPIVKMAEPILLNPNSSKNIEKILGSIKEFAGIPNKRNWVFVGCDGPPYVIASKVIERNPEKYGCLTMVPGLGHLHMNQQKTIFKIVDEILLEPLGKEVLNFESPNAYKFFVDAKDTHKSWQALQVLLIGCSLEFMRQYIKETPSTCDVSVTGFMQWQSSHFDANIRLLGQIILTYVLAAYFFKIGVRYNDVELIDASRLKFMDLFFAFNHPIYREVEYRDLRNRVSYPPNVRQLRDRNMSYSTTTLVGKSKGGDFLLEEKVKRQKLIAPKGPITNSTWKIISRSLDDFDEIYSAAANYMDLKDPDFARVKDLLQEVFEWRAVLRKSGYLSKQNFTRIPQNIYGEYLSDDMINFTTNVIQKRQEYFDQLEKLEKITFPSLTNLTVMRGKELEDMLYVGPTTDD